MIQIIALRQKPKGKHDQDMAEQYRKIVDHLTMAPRRVGGQDSDNRVDVTLNFLSLDG
jgi:hypothetical protein